jgi:hypothetical protein
MLSGPFEARDGALRSAHSLCHGVLRKPRAGACLEQLIHELVFELERVVRLGEAFARPRPFEESLVIMPYG